MEKPQSENRQPPIGLATVACLVCLALVHLATRPFIGFLDPWKIQWLLQVALPVAVAFFILYRSAWHQELPRVTRILSMLLSAGILYVVVLAGAAITVMVASVFFGNGMVSS